MNILEHLEILQQIKTLDDLKIKYNMKTLGELRVNVLKLIKETDVQFKKNIEYRILDKDLILKLWTSKTNLEKLNELIFQAMSAFEREDLITQTSLLTEKLNNVINIVNSF